MIPDKVHLVGSIALGSVEEVFRTAGKTLGRRLRRVPDGEPGSRRMWISYQYPFLRTQAFLKPDPSVPNPRGFPPLMLAENVDLVDIQFSELGYAREARISYQDFLAARKAGHLPADVRFQVSLPTPMAVCGPFISPKDEMTIETAYGRAMLREVETICRVIPYADLCIQWDVCIEMLLWDGRWETMGHLRAGDLHGEIMARMRRIGESVPEPVELGFHLCYGDLDAKHFVQPVDAAKLVEVANALTTAVRRPITYIHMPVPINRSDDAYFQPLTGLRLSPGTELYLGLVHADGVEATQTRIAAANKYVTDFGIATECGIARSRTPELVKLLLGIHAGASREPEKMAGAG
jgi:hypothetical protein